MPPLSFSYPVGLAFGYLINAHPVTKPLKQFHQQFSNTIDDLLAFLA
jgi:hypothetical protein